MKLQLTPFDVNFSKVSGISTFEFNDAPAESTTNTEITLGAKAEATGVTKSQVLALLLIQTATALLNSTIKISVASFTNGITFVGSTDAELNDSFTGGKGNDVFTAAEAGDATITGGLGIDTINFKVGDNDVTDLGIGGADVLVIGSGGSGVDATVGADWTATSSTINNNSVAGGNIKASGFDVDLSLASGTFGFDIDGDDTTGATLVGSSLTDDIDGGDSAESLNGGAGDDNVAGGDGADTIDGGTGDDALTGGVATSS